MPDQDDYSMRILDYTNDTQVRFTEGDNVGDVETAGIFFERADVGIRKVSRTSRGNRSAGNCRFYDNV